MRKYLAFLLAISMIMLAGCAKKETKAPETNEGITATPKTDENKTDNKENPPEIVKDHESAQYVNLLLGKNYTLKATINGNEFKMSVKDKNIGKSATLPGGAVKSVVVKDGITYMIDHSTKLVISSSVAVSSTASGVVGGDFNLNNLKFVKNGKDTFNGKSLNFDEYSTDGGAFKVYVDGGKIAGFGTTEDGAAVNYIVSELKSGTEADLLNVPSDYQLLDMAAQGG